MLDVYGTTAAVESTRTVAVGGRGYALWSTTGGAPSVRVAVHDADGWTDSIIVGTPSNPIGPTQLAVAANGDAFAAWSPACDGGPCASDPTSVAGYTAADDCWHEGRALQSGADAYGYGLPQTTGFLVTTVGSGYEARFMHCE